MQQSSRNARRAAVAVQVALTLTVLLGVLAIVVDGGLLLAQRRQQQAAADAAALAYAAAMAGGANSATAQASALAIAAANGAANDGVQSLITPNTADASGNALHGIWSGPISGTFVGKAGTTGYSTGYVEVVVEYDEVRLFSALWGSGTLPVRARAVAKWGSAVNHWNASILTLATSGTGLTNSTSQLTVPGPIFVNAGISVSGSGNIASTGGAINVVGPVAGTGYSPAPTTVSATTSDPLASLALPDQSSLTVQSTGPMNINSGSITLQPGVYQGGITIQGGATVTLNPGIYYLEGGGLSIQGYGTTMTGSGALIYNGQMNGAANNPTSVEPGRDPE